MRRIVNLETSITTKDKFNSFQSVFVVYTIFLPVSIELLGYIHIAELIEQIALSLFCACFELNLTQLNTCLSNLLKSN